MTDPSANTTELAQKFARAWTAPNPDRFAALLHPQCRLLQPATKPILGSDAARGEFERLIRWLPDIRGEVDRTYADESTLVIVWRLSFRLGGQPFELRIVDRIVMADGLIREREAYYDSLRFMWTLMRRPSAWFGYLRYLGLFGS